jgi:hypothetical protein
VGGLEFEIYDRRWLNSEEDVVTRACYFDDEYVFNADGSFNNVLGDETWIEGGKRQ